MKKVLKEINEVQGKVLEEEATEGFCIKCEETCQGIMKKGVEFLCGECDARTCVKHMKYIHHEKCCECNQAQEAQESKAEEAKQDNVANARTEIDP